MIVQIRRGHEADCDAVLATLKASFAPYQGRLNPPSGVHTETVYTLRDKLASQTLLVAEVDGRVVGCVFLMPFKQQEGDLYFGRLAVLPMYQKQGIARRLVEHVERYGREHGFQRVRLGVRIALSENVHTFQRLGYEIAGKGQHEGYDQATYYHMSKSLVSHCQAD